MTEYDNLSPALQRMLVDLGDLAPELMKLYAYLLQNRVDVAEEIASVYIVDPDTGTWLKDIFEGFTTMMEAMTGD